MLEFSLNYIIAINCRSIDDERVNHLYFNSAKNFSLEHFDFGSNIIYFKSLDNPKGLRIILKELLAPNYELCDVILITLNKDCIIERRKIYENHSNWMDYDIDGYDYLQKKWQENIKKIVSEFSNIEITYA